MGITAAQVNELRKKTGAGMMDCKKALNESNGDMEAAIDYLRKKGQKISAKRADRDATEGAVIAKVDQDAKLGVVLRLNCETDFVAKNDDFVSFANKLAEAALSEDIQDASLLMSHSDFESQRQQLVLTLGENIQVRRISHMMSHILQYAASKWIK